MIANIVAGSDQGTRARKQIKKNSKYTSLNNPKDQIYYHSMLIPGMIFLLLFSILPMFGIVIAFENFKPAKGIFGSKWVGFDNFEFMFSLPDTAEVFTNTLVIAVAKIVLGLLVPVIFAILLSEVPGKKFRKTVQVITYLPHFLSWVILAKILSNFLSLEGMVNSIVELLGGDPVQFLASNQWFRKILVVSDIWKGFGYSSIVYLAAIMNIDPQLYEAAAIDGASRLKRVFYVTLPGMLPIILLMLILSLGSVLSANFDQVFNLYSPVVYETGDIIDTWVYRQGLLSYQYSLATAVGLLKSVVSTVLIVISYKLADKFAGYRIF